MWVSHTYHATAAASQHNFGFNTFNYFRTFLITIRMMTFDANNNVITTERTIRMGDRLHPTVFSHETHRTDTEPRNPDIAVCLHSYTIACSQMGPVRSSPGRFIPGLDFSGSTKTPSCSQQRSIVLCASSFAELSDEDRTRLLDLLAGDDWSGPLAPPSEALVEGDNGVPLGKEVLLAHDSGFHASSLV